MKFWMKCSTKQPTRYSFPLLPLVFFHHQKTFFSGAQKKNTHFFGRFARFPTWPEIRIIGNEANGARVSYLSLRDTGKIMIENKKRSCNKRLTKEKKKRFSTAHKSRKFHPTRTTALVTYPSQKKKQKGLCGFFPPRLKDEEGDKVVNLKKGWFVFTSRRCSDDSLEARRIWQDIFHVHVTVVSTLQGISSEWSMVNLVHKEWRWRPQKVELFGALRCTPTRKHIPPPKVKRKIFDSEVPSRRWYVIIFRSVTIILWDKSQENLITQMTQNYHKMLQAACLPAFCCPLSCFSPKKKNKEHGPHLGRQGRHHLGGITNQPRVGKIPKPNRKG